MSIAPDPADGRGKDVSVTAAGRAARDAAITALDPVFAQLLAAIAETDLRQVLPTLQRVRQVLDAARD